MLLLILLAAWFVPAEQASTNCVDTGANIAGTQTQPVRGPGGATAVLKVSSSDDHSKNSHMCNAEYQLLVFSAGGGAPAVVDLLISDGEWGRSLTVNLDGFSQDGKQVLGVLSEDGKYSLTQLFEYSTADGKVQLTDLTKPLARVATANCRQTFDVIGTTATGAVVLALDSTKQCTDDRRWVVDPARGQLQRLSHGASILGLYKM